MLIFKESLPVDTLDIRRITLPFRSQKEAKRAILHLDLQYNEPCMWFQADVNGEEEIEKDFYLIAIGTGHPWGEALSGDEYLGTLLLHGGTLVLHYFLKEDLGDLGESER